MTDCVFCKIVKKEINTEFLYEDEEVVAFKDRAPSAPVHLLVVPIKHIKSLADAKNSDEKLLGKIQLVASKIAKENGIGDGFRVSTNSGKKAKQIVFHLHYHVMGGWEK